MHYLQEAVFFVFSEMSKKGSPVYRDRLAEHQEGYFSTADFLQPFLTAVSNQMAEGSGKKAYR